MLPSALWRSMGADVEQLGAILNVRLMLDDRKPVSMLRSPKQKKERKYGSLVNIFISFVLGLVYMMPIGVIDDRILSLTVYFSLLLAVIVFMLITDFSSVLFDTRDKYILFPKPVNDRTIVLAKMLHVFIYLFRIVLPMSLPGWILLGIIDGWKSAVLFVLPVVLLVIMTLFIVNGVYLLVLRLARPEKFKDVINYFQVFTSVLFFASVYFIPSVFDREHASYFNIIRYPWIRFVPPYWLAACWSWIGYPTALAGTGVYSMLAIVVPLACMYILVKFLSPQFSSRISSIDTVDTGNYEPVKATKRTSSGKLYQKLAAMFNRTEDAKAGFMIGWLQSSRSRSFRMRVYPSFAFIPIYFIYLLSQKKEPIADSFHHLAQGKMHLFLMYYSSLVMVSAMTYMTMSEQYKAAWVYYSTPIEIPGRIMIGAFKALLVKYFLPFFIAIAAFVIYVWGALAIWDVLLAFVNVTLFVSMMARINFRHLPFSLMEQMKQNGSRILKTFFAMLMPITLGFGHYLAFHLLWLKLIFLVLSAIMLWLVWDSYANTSWANVIKSEQE
jgi:ABC-2 type transport system permease protein